MPRLQHRLDGAIFPQLIGAQGLLLQGPLLPRANPYHATLLPLTPQASAASLAQLIAEQVESMLATANPFAATNPVSDLRQPHSQYRLHSGCALSATGQSRQLCRRQRRQRQLHPLACLFDNQRQLAYGVTCTLLPSNSFPFLEHGYQLSAQPMLATSSEANKIAYIDWQPAFQNIRG